MTKQATEVRPLIIAHRGASAHAPENTIAAFRLAEDAGANGIEFDVRLTRDGEVVVFHDASLKRIAGIGRKVIEYTARELARIDAGSWFNRKRPSRANEEFSRERIPTLRGALSSLREFEGLLYIELKCGDRDTHRLTDAVARIIRESPLLPHIVIKSFNLGAITMIKAICPAVRTAALFAPKVGSLLRQNLHLLRLAETAGADEISIHTTLATRKVVEEAALVGLDVIVWTADTTRWIRRAGEIGVMGIITNDPARMLARRDELFSGRPA